MTDMAASPYVKALDDIQKALTGFLKPVGFKKKGRTYNRQVGDGLVRVFGLQKVCYRGLDKNRHRLEVMAALTNLFMVRRRLLNA